ncbi:MAG TPA: serine hydrolase domain-containing protein [Rhodopila sp.]
MGEIVRHEVAAGHIPGAVVLIGERGRVVYRAAFGSMSLVPEATPMRPDAIFDLASLTKVIATTTAVMQLVELQRMQLDQPVSRYWPAFAEAGKAAITVRQLLTHTSGLRPDLDLARDWSGYAAGLDRVVAEHPVYPPGERFLYSDINFIVLGELVRRISGEPLDVYTTRHVFAPLHMADTGFHPAPARQARIVPTDREAGVVRRGEVQDPTAYRMGGVAGHAGLFSTADDLATFARALLGRGGGAHILRSGTIAEMTAPADLPGGVRRGLGWDSASAYAAGMDNAFGPRSFGHTGYTGTLLWIDPARQDFLVLLTSRLHPDGRGDAGPLRRQIAQALAASIPAAPPVEIAASPADRPHR